jgi:hypothetical protein
MHLFSDQVLSNITDDGYCNPFFEIIKLRLIIKSKNLLEQFENCFFVLAFPLLKENNFPGNLLADKNNILFVIISKQVCC